MGAFVRSSFVNDPFRSSFFNHSEKKNFVSSQHFRSFFIYFVRFLTERLFIIKTIIIKKCLKKNYRFKSLLKKTLSFINNCFLFYLFERSKSFVTFFIATHPIVHKKCCSFTKTMPLAFYCCRNFLLLISNM